MKTSMILARDIQGVIGIDNKLPWNVPADMALFIAHTKGKAVVMGRKTWDSLPVKPLPGRHNIILTDKSNYKDVVNAEELTNKAQVSIANSVEYAIISASQEGADEVVFIGGRSVYDQVVNYVDEVHVSELNLCVETKGKSNVDIYAQDFEDLGYVVASAEPVYESETGKYLLDYIRYVRPLER